MKKLGLLRLFSANKFIFILILGLFCISVSDARANELTSPISIRIEMDKDTFTLPEPIEGRVILTSMAPAKLQAIFNVEIFLNGSLQQSFFISFNTIWPGITPFSLKDFSIHLPMQVGQWRLVIKQQNLNEDKVAIADFAVKPAS